MIIFKNVCFLTSLDLSPLALNCPAEVEYVAGSGFKVYVSHGIYSMAKHPEANSY